MLSFAYLGALVAVVAPVIAAPTSILIPRDISSDVLSELTLFAEYSAAAYCTSNFGGSNGADVTCSAGNCPEVQSAGATLLYEFDLSNDFGDTTGYLAVDNTNQLIVLAFRGSSDISNWVANLDYDLTDVDLCDGCQAHSGWWSAWGSGANDITAQVQSAQSTYPGYKLVVTGHSLGGAIAALGGSALRNAGYQLDLYTYGQPRVGNKALAEYLTNQADYWRVTHENDIVPRLPPESFGFSHASPEFWITSDNGVTPTTSDVQEIEGIDSNAGNTGEAIPSIDAHKFYIIAISACS
ncbi:hypothetical protein N7468_007827 [Penicillium chermesinum]|uniref:Lipase n=1 Tax=Penicillium chermesinum TaxID=63820 RepID=A0A9W9NNL4_9EURO|nr:uncharacterized protein N7468_007827 [Penicillium chermesinum]KAJ5223285.1 hypothetical protein N7468_007827 [Penicillium chermesinum]KAJ6155876.1 hypothetical protein N7470_006442 [Penicillium chermesinum]